MRIFGTVLGVQPSLHLWEGEDHVEHRGCGGHRFRGPPGARGGAGGDIEGPNESPCPGFSVIKHGEPYIPLGRSSRQEGAEHPNQQVWGILG